MRYCYITENGHPFDFADVSAALPDHDVSSLATSQIQQADFANVDAVLIPGDVAALPGLERIWDLEIPVIGITEPSNDAQIGAFEAGVDEVVVWPISDRLLEIRRNNVAARLSVLDTNTQLKSTSEVIRLGPLELDPVAHVFSISGEPIELTPKEYDLIKFLLQRPGVCCTRDMILDSVWGFDFDTGTNMVDVYIYFLRKKLKQAGLGKILQTVRGQGYRLQVEETNEGNS